MTTLLYFLGKDMIVFATVIVIQEEVVVVVVVETQVVVEDFVNMTTVIVNPCWEKDMKPGWAQVMSNNSI